MFWLITSRCQLLVHSVHSVTVWWLCFQLLSIVQETVVKFCATRLCEAENQAHIELLRLKWTLVMLSPIFLELITCSDLLGLFVGLYRISIYFRCGSSTRSVDSQLITSQLFLQLSGNVHSSDGAFWWYRISRCCSWWTLCFWRNCTTDLAGGWSLVKQQPLAMNPSFVYSAQWRFKYRLRGKSNVYFKLVKQDSSSEFSMMRWAAP
jgi:hypothetical protein